LTNIQRRARERAEKHDDYIKRKIAQAEQADREGSTKADIIYEWQKRGQYTYDVNKDASDEMLKDENGDWLTSLPVYQRVITQDGQYELELSEAAINAIRDKIYCGTCEERQPDNEIERREKKKHMLANMDAQAFTLPDHVRRDDDLCVVCGAVLGFAGESTRDKFAAVTSEQKEILGLE
jgi:NAD-dependent dihydropyrimidine dehydrogenase PreA subunit